MNLRNISDRNASQIVYLIYTDCVFLVLGTYSLWIFGDISKTRPPFEIKLSQINYLHYIKIIRRFQKPKVYFAFKLFYFIFKFTIFVFYSTSFIIISQQVPTFDESPKTVLFNVEIKEFASMEILVMDEKRVTVIKKASETFIQTYKPFYKPGQPS